MVNNDRVSENKAATKKIVDMFVTGDLAEVHSIIASDYLDHQGLGGVENRARTDFVKL